LYDPETCLVAVLIHIKISGSVNVSIFLTKFFFMSPDKKEQASGGKKRKGMKARELKGNITPDGLVSTISQQNEALNNLIRKFSEPNPAKDMKDTPKPNRKFRNK
jgi:hypothetical protein